MKNKTVAAILALILGMFGVHRFYLGKRFWGVLHLLLFFFTMMITIEADAPVIAIPFLLGFIDAVLLFVMPKEEFDERYNRKYLYDTTNSRREERYSYQRLPAPKEEAAYYKRKGIQRYRAYDYDGAVDFFEQALDINYEDAATHFNLACCFSNLEDADAAFLHLEKAVESGFSDLEKIHTHPALAFLRTLPAFDDFINNDYRKPITADRPVNNLFDDQPEEPSKTDDLLQQIVKLGELRDKGILTDEEFAVQKRKILGEGGEN